MLILNDSCKIFNQNFSQNANLGQSDPFFHLLAALNLR